MHDGLVWHANIYVPQLKCQHWGFGLMLTFQLPDKCILHVTLAIMRHLYNVRQQCIPCVRHHMCTVILNIISRKCVMKFSRDWTTRKFCSVCTFVALLVELYSAVLCCSIWCSPTLLGYFLTLVLRRCCFCHQVAQMRWVIVHSLGVTVWLLLTTQLFEYLISCMIVTLDRKCNHQHVSM